VVAHWSELSMAPALNRMPKISEKAAARPSRALSPGGCGRDATCGDMQTNTRGGTESSVKSYVFGHNSGEYVRRWEPHRAGPGLKFGHRPVRVSTPAGPQMNAPACEGGRCTARVGWRLRTRDLAFGTSSTASRRRRATDMPTGLSASTRRGRSEAAPALARAT